MSYVLGRMLKCHVASLLPFVKERKKGKDRNFTESYFPATRNSSCVQRILMELKSFRAADRCTLYSHAADTAIGE